MPIQGLPLGVLPETDYPHMTARIGSPARLLLYTDGLTDTRNVAGHAYGQRRLRTWLRVNAIPGRNATELRDRLATELNRFRGDVPMVDDQAFLILTEEHAGVRPPSPTGGRQIRLQRGSFLFPISA